MAGTCTLCNKLGDLSQVVSARASAVCDFFLGRNSAFAYFDGVTDEDPANDWGRSKQLARAILHNRKERRRWMTRFLAVALAWLAIGLWVIDGWLAENAIRFVIWWLLCGGMALMLMVFALYDSIAVAREER